MIDLVENNKKLQDLEEKYLKLKNTIGGEEELSLKLKELEEKTLADGFWSNTKLANSILRNIKDVKGKYISLVEIKSSLENLIETNEFLNTEYDEEMGKDLARSTENLKKNIEKLETKMFLSGKFDKNNAIVTLHPGARWNRISRLGSNALSYVFKMGCK